ncbi:transposase ISPg6 [Thioalkalivibrio paradoxus ARh 1]|uniref:Transposase ISPg6 n=1 Tax=Thioalkalivibrio paradoxus ARh 1 TaxID=713585 RepID=W0DLM9_9GAMM|nr:transposase ISPg6 [Thioalkalivibrio paradoxus ARh 1]
MRSHWGIENQLHWALDATFREDDNRIRRDHAPPSSNTLRQFTLNLLKRYPDRRSIKRKRLSAAISDDFRANLVFRQAWLFGCPADNHLVLPFALFWITMRHFDRIV